MPEKEPQKQTTETQAGNPSSDMLDLAMAQALGLAMHNAVTAQQNAQTLNSAIVSATVARILSAKTITSETLHATDKPGTATPNDSNTVNRKK